MEAITVEMLKSMRREGFADEHIRALGTGYADALGLRDFWRHERKELGRKFRGGQPTDRERTEAKWMSDIIDHQLGMVGDMVAGYEDELEFEIDILGIP